MSAKSVGNPASKTLQAVAAALGVFIVGLAVGWFAKLLLFADRYSASGTVSQASSGNSDAAPGVRAARASGETTNEFISRLHDALSIPSRGKRERAMSAIADDLDATQVCAALAQLDKTHISQREQMRARLLAHWGELDPAAAIDYALALPRAPQSRDAVNAIVNGWAEKDADAAAGWIAKLPDSAMKESALETLIKTVAGTDPKTAFTHLRSAPLMNVRGTPWKWLGLVNSVFSGWADKNPLEAATAAAGLDKSFRDTALSIVGARWANTDIDSAMAWAHTRSNDLAKQRLGASTFATNAVTGALETWLHRDPEVAMAWLEESARWK